MVRRKHMQEKVYTTEEVAQQLRVDAATVRKWIRSGGLAAIDVGGEYRIPESSLQEFIKKRLKRQNNQP